MGGGAADGDVVELPADVTAYVREIPGTWAMHLYQLRPWPTTDRGGRTLWVRQCLVWAGAG